MHAAIGLAARSMRLNGTTCGARRVRHGETENENIMLGNIGSVELFVIMLTILLLFGAKRIPEVARAVGSGIREFRAASRAISKEFQINADDVNAGPTRSKSPAARSSTFGTQVDSRIATQTDDPANSEVLSHHVDTPAVSAPVPGTVSSSVSASDPPPHPPVPGLS